MCSACSHIHVGLWGREREDGGRGEGGGGGRGGIGDNYCTHLGFNSSQYFNCCNSKASQFCKKSPCCVLLCNNWLTFCIDYDILCVVKKYYDMSRQ